MAERSVSYRTTIADECGDGGAAASIISSFFFH
jgi:hypothetical protein